MWRKCKLYEVWPWGESIHHHLSTFSCDLHLLATCPPFLHRAITKISKGQGNASMTPKLWVKVIYQIFCCNNGKQTNTSYIKSRIILLVNNSRLWGMTRTICFKCLFGLGVIYFIIAKHHLFLCNQHAVFWWTFIVSSKQWGFIKKSHMKSMHRQFSRKKNSDMKICEIVVRRHLLVFAVLREGLLLTVRLATSHNPSDSWLLGNRTPEIHHQPCLKLAFKMAWKAMMVTMAC